MNEPGKSRDERQLLHLVFGGELEDPSVVRFRDLDKLDIVGIFPNYATALQAWRARAQATVDNAHMRYFIVHMHRLLDPGSGGQAE
ncbi:MAG: inositol monophosphatase [Alphaproteobacteria bacterium]|nr:MAG: inositol monophosphatase [Alphaproteobacteria bacterium]